MGVGIIPICNCGELAVVKMAKTSKNARRYFWGCGNYKSGTSSVMSCNYFKWCNEEKVDERDVIIGSQRRKICDMEKTVSALTRRNQFLVAVVCVLSVVVCVLSGVFLG
ncbi:uncharacterized protein LOC111241523 [Vigna radiata var. radiata]|uniref:Uncharacterized protein LOC111241523 n=1 Tax=Vigna radiata var. radiata TaxID=3916 RepID=A0A3Q0EXL5_VIGRR|nr:uncharacterized protein LOC111241523 [Vigna radiata var. radiata]